MKAASKLAAYLLAVSFAAPAGAQTPRPWFVPELLSAAKSEGNTLTIYASMNEDEALPYWSVFEAATGIKVNFLRMSQGPRSKSTLVRRYVPQSLRMGS